MPSYHQVLLLIYHCNLPNITFCYMYFFNIAIEPDGDDDETPIGSPQLTSTPRTLMSSHTTSTENNGSMDNITGLFLSSCTAVVIHVLCILPLSDSGDSTSLSSNKCTTHSLLLEGDVGDKSTELKDQTDVSTESTSESTTSMEKKGLRTSQVCSYPLSYTIAATLNALLLSFMH